MTECSVTEAEFASFAAGESHDLIDHVASCAVCQERLEASIESETADRDHGLVDRTMRAVRLAAAGKEMATMFVDVAGAFGRALAAYTVRSNR